MILQTTLQVPLAQRRPLCSPVRPKASRGHPSWHLSYCPFSVAWSLLEQELSSLHGKLHEASTLCSPSYAQGLAL